MDNAANIPNCPFCPFSDADGQFVAEHIEFCHPENGAPSEYANVLPANLLDGHAQDSPTYPNDADDSAEKYVDCPHDCGEVVERNELDTHLDLHVAEDIALEDSGAAQTEQQTSDVDSHRFDDLLEDKYAFQTKGRQATKGFSQRAPPKKNNRTRSPDYGSVPADGVRRLGRAELGPHAHEKKMPSWLRKMLEKGANTTRTNRITADGTLERYEEAENEVANVIPALARLCAQDKSVQRAFFCSPKARHIFKMAREGGFCGYRNIQMLVSYIQHSKSPGHEHFPGSTPTILTLQDMIEQAWDMGFNSTGRIETGGIRGTRKYIGTPEAQALFMSLGIPCEANSVGETQDIRAHDALYLNVAEYFRQAGVLDGDDKTVITDLAPVYLQYQGHSMTVVGFEIRVDGSANLLVFDPMFKSSPAMKRFIQSSAKPSDPTRLLKAYRRGTAYLQKYKLFEILKLSNTTLSPEAPES